mgnify:CR=1 FL=1
MNAVFEHLFVASYCSWLAQVFDIVCLWMRMQPYLILGDYTEIYHLIDGFFIDNIQQLSGEHLSLNCFLKCHTIHCLPALHNVAIYLKYIIMADYK